MPSPKLVPLPLTDADREALEALVRERTASQALALRSRIVLAARRTVALRRSRRSPRKITDQQVEVVVTRVLAEQGPGQDTHWSTRTMAAETGLSQGREIPDPGPGPGPAVPAGDPRRG